MGIGTSKGAFYRDEGHYAASMWDNKYDDNVVNPNGSTQDQNEIPPQVIEDSKTFAPPTIKVSNDLVIPNKMGITDQDIDTGIDVTMGAGAGIIAGVRSATGKAATGWFKGSDGKMRYEISDEGMKLTGKELKPGDVGKLKDYVEHPELYKAYPEMGETGFRIAHSDEKYIAHYSAGTLTVNPSKITAGNEGLLDVIAHEAQHVVQGIEKFAGGTNPTAAGAKALRELGNKVIDSRDPKEITVLHKLYSDIKDNIKSFSDYMYLRTPGEVEANTVAARRKLTAAERDSIGFQETTQIRQGEPNTMHGGTYQPEFNYP